jgi:ATP-binding cassette subfamily F protein 3
LRAFEGELILITHNRDFMDAVCTHTMGIVRKKIEMIPGDTHKFYEQLASNDELYAKQKIAQDKKVKELEEFIAKNKARASTASLAQSKVKQLEKMDLMDSLAFDNTLEFNFNFKETPSKLMLEVENLSFGYTEDNILFKDIAFSIQRGECIGIIGKNGKGKSTLLNTLAGELKALSGEIRSHPSIEFAHFGQTNIARLHENATLSDEIHSANTKLSTQVIRSICGAMMFSGDAADKKISLLSGGEKSRVMLGQILARQVNLLFLDEPTNHLDMDSIEALTNAILTFEGGVIIVTHSEELLRRVCDRLIIFAKDGAQYFDGGYDLFLEKIGWEEEEREEVIKAAPKSNTKENKKLKAELVRQRNKITSPLKKKVEKLENSIMELEEQLEMHHQELIEVSNLGDSSKVMELSKVVSGEENHVEKMFEEFEELSMELEAINEEYETKIEELS